MLLSKALLVILVLALTGEKSISATVPATNHTRRHSIAVANGNHVITGSTSYSYLTSIVSNMVGAVLLY